MAYFEAKQCSGSAQSEANDYIGKVKQTVKTPGWWDFSFGASYCYARDKLKLDKTEAKKYALENAGDPPEKNKISQILDVAGKVAAVGGGITTAVVALPAALTETGLISKDQISKIIKKKSMADINSSTTTSLSDSLSNVLTNVLGYSGSSFLGLGKSKEEKAADQASQQGSATFNRILNFFMANWPWLLVGWVIFFDPLNWGLFKKKSSVRRTGRRKMTKAQALAKARRAKARKRRSK